MTCNTCGAHVDSVKSIVQKGRRLNGCDLCLPKQMYGGAEGFSKHMREYQKRQYRKDLVQPNQRDYAKAYPEQARKEWGDETFRKHA